MPKQLTIFILSLFIHGITLAQQVKVPSDRILSDKDLLFALSADNPQLQDVYLLRNQNQISKALEKLADFYKEKLSQKYLFSWKEFKRKFEEYSASYITEVENHSRRANEQMSEYPSDTKWILPFTDNKGDQVTAYRLRHLARQHKAVDIALDYFTNSESDNHLDYFINQVRSLNNAFEKNEFDDSGNAIYESFRCGYRVINWLFAHNAFLSSKKYAWQDQILLIKTFLHHGAQLHKRTAKFSSGNHHTKGLVALFLISVLFEDFYGTNAWRDSALNGIKLHLQKEVNYDGFQFERSIHYHKGDIDNYFLAYLLAKKNKIDLPEEFDNKFLMMFDVLVKLSQPDYHVPVLQDDTDEPWAEFNTIDRAMLMGYLITYNSSYLKFINNKIPADLFWFIDTTRLSLSTEYEYSITMTSTELESTGYFIMKNGEHKNDLHMVISAGKSDIKPDHQHGDMLGITAYGFGNQLLPNYQVRYFLPDYSFFKNSWVKSVALVDSIPQGLNWIPNEGGSGFGKWKNLPNPKTLAWSVNEEYDYYAGTHDGYEERGVSYTREVLFVKDGFWIVKDKFETNDPHSYQQLWQGNYDILNNNHIRSSFANGSGLEILQFSENDFQLNSFQFRGKNSTLFSKDAEKDFSFITLLYPYAHFDQIIPESKLDKNLMIKGWIFQKGGDIALSAEKILSTQSNLVIHKNKSDIFLFNCSSFNIDDFQSRFSEPVNLRFIIENEKLLITLLNNSSQTLFFSEPQTIIRKGGYQEKGIDQIKLEPAETISVTLDELIF